MNPSTTFPTPESARRSAQISKTIAYYAVFIALGFASASLGPTLPGLAEHTHTQLRDISFLFTGRASGYLLGSLLGGRLYDRLPGHRVMMVVLVAMIALMALVPLMPLLGLLTLVIFFLGMSEGTLDVGGNTLLVWVHREKVAPFMNGLHFFFGVGAFLAPIIIAQALLLLGDITAGYWALALLMIPILFWLVPLPSPAGHRLAEDGSRAPVHVNTLLVLLISIFFFIYVGAEASFGGWIFTYTVARQLTTETVAAFLTSAFWGSLTLGRLLAIPVARRFRPRSILLADLLGCLAGIAIIVLFPNSLLAIWVGAFTVGLSMASIFPTMLSFAERRMTITGRVTGWFFVGAGAGGMFLPWLIGQLFESIGPQIMLYLIFGDMLFAIGVFAAVIIFSAQRQLQTTA